MKNSFYVYILVSHANEQKHYSGFATDLEERLLRHNRGECPYTAKDRPGELKRRLRLDPQRRPKHSNDI